MQLNTETRKGFTTTSDGGPSLGIAGTVLALVTMVALLHPHPIVLPLLSVILVTAGFMLAGLLALSRTAGGAALKERLLLPSLIVFFGFAAGMLADPIPAIQSLQAMR